MELFEASKDLDDPILKAYEWIKEAEENSVALPHAHEFGFSKFRRKAYI